MEIVDKLQIIGFKTVLPDEMNKLIFMFGNQSKSAQILKHANIPVSGFDGVDYLRSRMDEIYEKRHEYVYSEFLKLTKIESMECRRNKFEDLPKWVRKEMLRLGSWYRGKLFPVFIRLPSDENYEFLKRQCDVLNFKYFTIDSLV